MTDKLTPQQRHKCMSRIRSKDTKPEMIVRKWLWSEGGALPSRIRQRKASGRQVAKGDTFVSIRVDSWLKKLPRFQVGQSAKNRENVKSSTIFSTENVKIRAIFGRIM